MPVVQIKAYGWECPFCHESSTSDFWEKVHAQAFLDSHLRDRHGRDPKKPCGGCGLTPSAVSKVPFDERLGCCAPLANLEADK